MSVYSKIGVNKVVNAAFALTRLGGSTLHPEVLRAMEEANQSYCYLWDLMEKAGDIISKHTEAEAAWPTSGAFSALVLSAAACIAGKDPEKMRRLPDTTGMKNEIIIQRANRLYVYDRAMELPGGKFVFVGDERWGCTPKLLENAITENTVAIHHAITSELPTGVLKIDETVEVAHDYGIPLILDAAGKTWPLDGLKKFSEMGVDLACYGGKYVGGPNSSGWVQGRKDLIEAIALQSFIGAEAGPEEQGGFYRGIGRGYKMDRQEVVGLIVALKRWLKMDHEKERIQPAWYKAHYIEDRIKKIKGLQDARFRYHPASGKGCGYHTIGIELHFDDRSEKEVRSLVYELRKEDPEVWVRYRRGKHFIINTLNLQEGDEEIIVKRFREIPS